MKKIYSTLVLPIVNRLGTVAATWLVTLGADAELATQFINATIATILVGVDLILDWKGRQGRGLY